MQKIAIGLLIFTLSACGWHSRGGDNLPDASAPMDLLVKASDNYSPLVITLRETLPVYNIIEVNSASEKALTLSIGSEHMDRRTAGVGSNALTNAYEMTISVDYSVTNQDGELTPTGTKARVSRTYNYNVNNANSAEQEEKIVISEMRRELSQSILRRTRSISAKETGL